jgi:hypothetical protein
MSERKRDLGRKRSRRLREITMDLFLELTAEITRRVREKDLGGDSFNGG